jgi:hypothetical protein
VRDALSGAFARGIDGLAQDEWENLCDDVVIALVLKIAAGLDFETGAGTPLSRLRVVIEEGDDDSDIIARGGLDPTLEAELGRSLGD